MSKPTLIVFPEMLKAHVAGYTRKDGVFVQEHDDKRQAAAPAASTMSSRDHTDNHHDLADHHNDQAYLAGKKGDDDAMNAHEKAASAHNHAARAHRFQSPENAMAMTEKANALSDALKSNPAGKQAAAPVHPAVAHAVAAGAKHKSGVAAFSNAGAAHSFAAKASGAKGGAQKDKNELYMNTTHAVHKELLGHVDALKKKGYSVVNQHHETNAVSDDDSAASRNLHSMYFMQHPDGRKAVAYRIHNKAFNGGSFDDRHYQDVGVKHGGDIPDQAKKKLKAFSGVGEMFQK